MIAVAKISKFCLMTISGDPTPKNERLSVKATILVYLTPDKIFFLLNLMTVPHDRAPRNKQQRVKMTLVKLAPNKIELLLWILHKKISNT